MKLQQVDIHKYKSIESKQSFAISDPITVLVGMNESGKTAVLEAVAKVNYFQTDKKFTFDVTHDYPRKEKKQLDKSGNKPPAVTLTFSIGDDLLARIATSLGDGVFLEKSISFTQNYGALGSYGGVRTDKTKFVANFKASLGFDEAAADRLIQANSAVEFQEVLETISDEETKKRCASLSRYYENKWEWPSDCLSEYVARVFIGTSMPKFLYYDEFYALPSEVIIKTLGKMKRAWLLKKKKLLKPYSSSQISILTSS